MPDWPTLSTRGGGLGIQHKLQVPYSMCGLFTEELSEYSQERQLFTKSDLFWYCY
jgi:hypothetical protein